MTELTTFERKLAALREHPERPAHLVEAAEYVRKTLELALDVVVDVTGFGRDVDMLLGVYDRINAERLRRAEMFGDDAA